MKRKDSSQLRAFWNEFRRVKFGTVGLALFAVFVLIVLFEPLLMPYPDANDRWRDMTYWLDSPRNAKPVWVNWFTSKDYAVADTIEPTSVTESQVGSLRMVMMEFEYDFHYQRPPADLQLVTTLTGNASIQMELIRPDGASLNYQRATSSSGTRDIRVSVAQNLQDKVFRLASAYADPDVIASENPETIDAMATMFAAAEPNMLRATNPLEGTYICKLTVALTSADSRVDDAMLVIAGGVAGWMGTDASKRDIWSGLIAGTKWALLIGLVTSFVSVAIGVVYGVVAGYFGGWVDSMMNRIFEVFLSMPLLPILIVMGAVFKPSIWTMIIMMCLFFWVGPVKTVRSMALQIKENTYIEAAKALGASHGRIVFKHLLPQLVPYAFATMALSVPSAIVYEASISLIGLGDATVVTWGQILQDAYASGAVLQGTWWWVVPPGLAIALMGMTFAFIGFAMDTILNPKLRTR
ncbi:ABC transporter permease [Candidatus Bipolaricaulota bacterium]|nr:ABC transporter permease [Candidatus Bipolaricaulota bacterium]